MSIQRQYDTVSRIWEVAPPPAAPREEPFEVLSRRRQNPLTIDLHEGAQAEPSQSVPLLTFTKQRLNPDLAFLIGLFVRRSLVIRRYAL